MHSNGILDAEEALEPFARFADKLPADFGDDEVLLEGVVSVHPKLTVGHFRDAKATLEHYRSLTKTALKEVERLRSILISYGEKWDEVYDPEKG